MSKRSIFLKITKGKPDKVAEGLKEFYDLCENMSEFPILNGLNLRLDVWKTLLWYLSNDIYSSLHLQCLRTLRVLSRDKTDLDNILTLPNLTFLLTIANLFKENKQKFVYEPEVIFEGQKLLCNILFNSPKVQVMIGKPDYLRCLIERIENPIESFTQEMRLFDIRILFLVTAFNEYSRRFVKNEFKGDVCLAKILEDISSQYNSSPIKEDDVNLACEILKTLFNVYIHVEDPSEKVTEKFKNLVSILRKLILCQCEIKKEELHSNIVNLLTEVPPESYSNLLQPVESDNCTNVYENTDMSVIKVLLQLLDIKLEYKLDLIENITPVLSCLIKLVKSERLMRKFMRLEILPPLKDVMKRPEEGNTTKAKLCQLLTSPITEIRDLVAEFLFILCKENVDRMIKYTGYGNAAGMFANKGLLGHPQPKTDYSSESEDSETEEYSKYKEQINPVTGCYEKPKPNPLEGMSEEQKEYEVMQLIGLVDKLTREGVVQPCRIGEDGKPVPIEHVLELQNNLPKQQTTCDTSDSD